MHPLLQGDVHFSICSVDLVIHPKHISGKLSVLVCKRIKTVAEHSLDSLTHTGKIQKSSQMFMSRQIYSQFGNVDGPVTHAFQIVVCLQSGDKTSLLAPRSPSGLPACQQP